MTLDIKTRFFILFINIFSCNMLNIQGKHSILPGLEIAFFKNG